MKFTPSVHNYTEAAAHLGTRRARKLANNTTLERSDTGSIELKLHGSAIVIYQDNGTVTLNTCGWPTPTTIERLNEFGPSGWSVSCDHDKLWVWQHGTDYKAGRREFKDGIVFCPDGISAEGRGVQVEAMRSGWGRK